MDKFTGNQWAFLTNFSLNQNFPDITTYGDNEKQYIPGLTEIKFEGIAPATPEIMKVISRWMFRENPKFPIFQEEWMCLYCGSPNQLPTTHCSQCGAPRNWFIG